jgi:hypothetical protein
VPAAIPVAAAAMIAVAANFLYFTIDLPVARESA